MARDDFDSSMTLAMGGACPESSREPIPNPIRQVRLSRGMKTTLLAALLGSTVLAVPALAADDCACGEAGCTNPAACTCATGICGLHGKGMGMGPMRGGTMGERPVFDAKTVVTVKGVVKELEKHPHGPGFVGLHLKLAVGAELITVHLGPTDFVEPKLTFAAGDAVEVTGSRMMFQGEPTMLATVVKKGAKSLELRGADGLARFRAPPAR